MRTYQPRQYYAQVKEKQAFPQKDSLRTFCFMNLCFLLCFFMFSWRKNTIIKYSSGYVGERFAGFLEIQIYAPWPSYCNNIFVLHLLMATMVIPIATLCNDNKKIYENIRNAKENICNSRKKKEKGGPIITCLHIRVSCLFNMIP
jgi:hypothetical protein